MNKKVHHDVTHKDYPNFDLFQDIQSQNNLSTTQLNIGYKGDALKSQLKENTIWERQAAPQLSRYPRLANAKMLLMPQIQACHLKQTCSKQQKSIGRLQRWRRPDGISPQTQGRTAHP
jgi:hypothetical protein